MDAAEVEAVDAVAGRAVGDGDRIIGGAAEVGRVAEPVADGADAEVLVQQLDQAAEPVVEVAGVPREALTSSGRPQSSMTCWAPASSRFTMASVRSTGNRADRFAD